MRQDNPRPWSRCLDRRFTAVFSGAEIDLRFPGGGGRTAIQRGFLQEDGLASTIPRCICDLHRPECVVDVLERDGAYVGMCDENGQPMAVTKEQIRRYRFDGVRWAAWIRRKNSLGGPDPVLGAGAMFVGHGSAAGRPYALVVVAPGCRHAADVVLPREALHAGRPIAALLLGEPVEDLRVGATIPFAALGDDLGTIDLSAIERALAGAGSAGGRPVSAALAAPQKIPGRPPTANSQAERIARVLKEHRSKPMSYEELGRLLPAIGNIRAAVDRARTRYPGQIERAEDPDGWVTFAWKG